MACIFIKFSLRKDENNEILFNNKDEGAEFPISKS